MTYHLYFAEFANWEESQAVTHLSFQYGGLLVSLSPLWKNTLTKLEKEVEFV